MHHLKGNNVDVANAEGLVLVNLVELDGRDTRIAVICKTVGQHLEHALASDGVGIDIDFAKLTIGTNVVHATHMVVVGMGDENSVNLAERLRHNLLAEVWTTVDEQSRLFSLYECRTTQSLIMRVGTTTRIAVATDSGHATRCSCS